VDRDKDATGPDHCDGYDDDNDEHVLIIKIVMVTVCDRKP